ncbi:MAG: hypothetical protein QRY72_03655 [Candidatus Rhabdochlamydia sp.]
MFKVIGVALLLELKPMGFDWGLIETIITRNCQFLLNLFPSYLHFFHPLKKMFFLGEQSNSWAFFSSCLGQEKNLRHKKFDTRLTSQSEQGILTGSYQNLDIAVSFLHQKTREGQAELFSELDEISQQLWLTYTCSNWAYNDHFDWKCNIEQTLLFEPQQECIFGTSGKEMARNLINDDQAKPLSNMAKELNNQINWEI